MLASALFEMISVQLYKNNARALLLHILSILNLDWLQHACSVCGVYELSFSASWQSLNFPQVLFGQAKCSFIANIASTTPSWTLLSIPQKTLLSAYRYVFAMTMVSHIFTKPCMPHLRLSEIPCIVYFFFQTWFPGCPITYPLFHIKLCTLLSFYCTIQEYDGLLPVAR